MQKVPRVSCFRRRWTVKSLATKAPAETTKARSDQLVFDDHPAIKEQPIVVDDAGRQLARGALIAALECGRLGQDAVTAAIVKKHGLGRVELAHRQPQGGQLALRSARAHGDAGGKGASASAACSRSRSIPNTRPESMSSA